MLQSLSVIIPDWSAPVNVTAFTTTIDGGISTGDCAHLNLGTHVGDNPQHVVSNRQRLQQHVGSAVELCWLHQTHSDMILNADNYRGVVEADAAVTGKRNTACVVMTADCLPVLLCNVAGTKIAALHCGWKGLLHHLIGKTLTEYFADEMVLAWLGPAIGQNSYEVDESLYQRFIQKNKHYVGAFINSRPGHYLFDLYHIAHLQLQVGGVSTTRIYGGGFDTFTDRRFFSYRRSAHTGRMASVIYFS